MSKVGTSLPQDQVSQHLDTITEWILVRALIHKSVQQNMHEDPGRATGQEIFFLFHFWCRVCVALVLALDRLCGVDPTIGHWVVRVMARPLAIAWFRDHVLRHAHRCWVSSQRIQWQTSLFCLFECFLVADPHRLLPLVKPLAELRVDTWRINIKSDSVRQV